MFLSTEVEWYECVARFDYIGGSDSNIGWIVGGVCKKVFEVVERVK